MALAGTTLSADQTKSVAGDVGLQTITVQVKSDVYTVVEVLPVLYTFKIDIKHCTVNTMTIGTISDVKYFVNDLEKQIAFAAPVWSDLACVLTVTYTATYVKDGQTISKPAFITFDGVNHNFKVQTDSGLNVGVYQITLKASIPQPTDPSGEKFVSTAFTLTVESNCGATQLVDMTVSAMTVKLTIGATQNINFQNTKAVAASSPTLCGQTEITWGSSLPAFMSIDIGVTGPTALNVVTSNLADVNTYPLQFTVCLKDVPTVACITKSFTVTVVCEVL